jgi:pimeloyl-ACP methyl ester carboxylesterase
MDNTWRRFLRLRYALPALAVLLLNICAYAGAPAVLAQAQPKPTVPAPVHPPAQTVEGSWSGTLQAGEAVLHLVLHISKGADGSLKAVIDSLDQGVYGIEVTSLARHESTLKLEISSVSATYEGKISADRQKIEGIWSQAGAGLALEFHRQSASAAAKKPSDAVFPVEGLWQGALETSGMRFRVQLHVSHDDKNELVAALDSIDQGVNGLPATKITQKEAAFHFEVPAFSGVYEGTLNAAKNALTGVWTQAGVEQRLEFKRSDQVLELRRPQNPTKPYPYREEEVVFPNSKSGVSLAGTLTIPRGPGPFALALLLCGSGPHDRDESLAGHRPFLVLADHLTRQGIAVLRYDKRGMGKSTGKYDEATSEDFANDAEAAIAFLKARKEIDPQRIGLIGHSEGGIIAPMLAARSTDVHWIVLLAGPGLKGEDVLLNQSELIARAASMSESQIATSLSFDRQAYALVREEKDHAALDNKLNDLVKTTGMAGAMPPAALQAQFRLIGSPWFRFFLDYDPVPALQKTKCPVLALNGDKDLQVSSKENLPPIQKALEAGGNTDFQIMELAGLNHLFQHCQSGSPTEYGAIEETMAPGALNNVSNWILKHVNP